MEDQIKTVGETLRELRIQKKKSLEEFSKITKIKVSQLEDLENDNFKNFPVPTYVRGFVRIYARALGVDGYKLIQKLDMVLASMKSEALRGLNEPNHYVEISLKKQKKISRQDVSYIVISLVIFLVLCVLGYKVWQVFPAFFKHDPEVKVIKVILEEEKDSQLLNSSSLLISLPISKPIPRAQAVPGVRSPVLSNSSASSPQVTPRARPVLSNP